MSLLRTELQQLWGSESVYQLAELCQKVVPGNIEMGSDETTFTIARNEGTGEGILITHGSLSENIISISIEILRSPGEARVPLELFFTQLTQLGEMVKLIPQPAGCNEPSLWIGLKVKASPMSLARSSLFLEELRRIDELARLLQSHLPVTATDDDLEKKYASLKGSLTPVYPWRGEKSDDTESLYAWAEELFDLMCGSTCIALSCPHPVRLNLALSALAKVLQKAGSSLGLVSTPAVPSKDLVKTVSGAPGYVTVPAISLSLGSSIYELGNEIRSLLTTLADANTPVVFTGSYAQLQSLFHGGQGGGTDPLAPVIRHVPEVSLETLARFSINWAGRLMGGVGSTAQDDLAAQLIAALQNLGPGEHERVLPAAARRVVKQWTSGRAKGDISSYVVKIGNLSETVAGLSSAPRAIRSPEVQERFVKVLTDPELLPFLTSRLLAQDQALEQLVARLSMECLTRPLHQPLRYCAQGTPATGKSQSAALLAERLGVPLVNIDAASIPDYYTAAAQLLGSGRGIVGSYQSGRLEQAAKHHAGVVIEISDLDHASPSVRSALADLFLQVMEVGEATSAVGATFSCSNAILAFTMNLPDGMDENVRRSIGFNNKPSRREVTAKVASHIKDMLSSAFLSRVGTPIPFEPLSGLALGQIVELAIRKALEAATQRLGYRIAGIEVIAGTGMKLISSLDSTQVSFGARLLLEQGRMKAAEALMELNRSGISLEGKRLLVSSDKNVLTINAVEGGQS